MADSPRSWLRRWHPEGIPWPASIAYNAFSRSEAFRLLEEPFLDPDEMLSLARDTRFGSGTTHFTGALCCLALRKTTGAPG